ncbi:hypothetical protein [Streptomyces sp. NBC_01180]|uniref:hypothetical protein n=1 Tax=Streptomyces sp. NBC_01180 TaxID=2903763 RepID=UPI0038702D4B|nr:hypothetical protein OG708_12065 [Streptomyces sp. NBC_01180]
MMYQSRNPTGTNARLLPWANLNGDPCYLLGDADGTSTSHITRVADNIESVQLGMADDLLDHAADLLGDHQATAHQLRFLAARLTESLHDIHRIARSRGGRLPVPEVPEMPEVPDDEHPGEHPGD